MKRDDVVEVVFLLNAKDVTKIVELLHPQAFFYQKLIYWALEENLVPKNYRGRKIKDYYFEKGYFVVELEDGLKVRV